MKSVENSQRNYNLWFLERLKTKRPELMEFVRTAEHEGVEYIYVEIPPPVGQEDAMRLSTCGRELTMFYHEHHVHFDMFEEENSDESFDDFIEYIDTPVGSGPAL